MLYFVRSATIRQGKYEETFQWAVKIAAWVNENYPDVNVRVLRNVSGPGFQVHWVATCESLALFGEISAKLNADPGYQDVIAGGEEFLVQKSLVDAFYEQVE